MIHCHGAIFITLLFHGSEPFIKREGNENLELEFLETFQDQKLKEREKQLSVYLNNVVYQ